MVLAAVRRPGMEAAARADGLSVLMRSSDGILDLARLAAEEGAEAKLRQEALVQVGSAGPNGQVAIPALVGIAEAADGQVRREALIALADVCTGEKPPTPPLSADLLRSMREILGGKERLQLRVRTRLGELLRRAISRPAE